MFSVFAILVSLTSAQQLLCSPTEDSVSVYKNPAAWQGNTYLGPLFGSKTPFSVLSSGHGQNRDYSLIQTGSCGEQPRETFTGYAKLPGSPVPCKCPYRAPSWPFRDESGLTSVPYDPPSGVCKAGNRPGVVALRNVIRRALRSVSDGGIYNCRETAMGSPSEHAEGRAWDAGIRKNDQATGNALANWLVKHARELKIQSVIWNRKVWGFGGASWGDYCTDSSPCAPKGKRNPHTDHVHVGLTIAGAASLTEADVQAVLSADPLQAGMGAILAGRAPSRPRAPAASSRRGRR